MRRGISSTEVIVCTAIFALALLPIINMITSGTRPAAYNEYHLIAQSVSTYLVERVCETIHSRGFAELETFAVGDKVNIQETKTYKTSTEGSGLAGGSGNVFSSPQVFLTNLSVSGASLVQISVVMTWTLPGDKHTYSFSLERLISRPDAALTADYVPRQEKGGGS